MAIQPDQMQPAVDLNFLEVQSQVNQIWSEYDKDKNGYLDKSEARKLAKVLYNLKSEDDLNDNVFETIFKQFDINNNGTIDQLEMAMFLMTLYKPM